MRMLKQRFEINRLINIFFTELPYSSIERRSRILNDVITNLRQIKRIRNKRKTIKNS